MTPKVPPSGHRFLAWHEVIEEGDKYWSNVHNKWMNCMSPVGGLAGEELDLSINPVVRPGEPAPPPEKLWLNPWD